MVRDEKGQFVKGSIPWSKGKKGVWVGDGTSFKQGQSSWNKGLKGYRKGHVVTEETRKKIGSAQI